jgi:chemotaxis protein methyltransferase CheR
MDEIVNAVKRVTDIMGEISAASTEQSQGIEQVNQAIAQMDETTQQNAALVEEAAAAAESLQDQAGAWPRRCRCSSWTAAAGASPPRRAGAPERPPPGAQCPARARARHAQRSPPCPIPPPRMSGRSSEHGRGGRAPAGIHVFPQDFEEVRKMIYDHAGIALSDAKEDMVYSRLARRLRATGLRSFQDYLALIRAGHADEWEPSSIPSPPTSRISSARRTTSSILKDFLKNPARPAHHHLEFRLQHREEPYSIAMTAVEALGGFDAPVEVLASDLDTNVLKKAADGVYPLERLASFRSEPAAAVLSAREPATRRVAKVKPELRAMVKFFRSICSTASGRWRSRWTPSSAAT